MKKTFYSVLRTMCVGAMTLFAVSCYDDTALWGEIDRLDGRVDSLANVLNKDVAALAALQSTVADLETSLTAAIAEGDAAVKKALEDQLAKVKTDLEKAVADGDKALADALAGEKTAIEKALTDLTTGLTSVTGSVENLQAALATFEATVGKSYEALLAQLDELDGLVDGTIADFTAALKALQAADQQLNTELVAAIAKIAVVKVDEVDGKIVLTLADGKTVEVSKPLTNVDNNGLVTMVDVDGVKYWQVVGAAEHTGVQVGHPDQKIEFQINGETNELEYRVNGAEWTSTGVAVQATAENVKVITGLEQTDDYVKLTVGGAEIVLPKYVSDDSSIEASATDFFVMFGASRTLELTAEGIVEYYVMAKPDGWKAKIDGTELTVTAPTKAAAEIGAAEIEGQVLIHGTTKSGKCVVTSIDVNTGKGLTINIAEGNIVVKNAYAQEQFNHWGDPMGVNFIDYYVGIIPTVELEDKEEYFDYLKENWEVPAGFAGMMHNNYDVEFPTYEEGVYEIEVVEMSVESLYKWLGWSDKDGMDYGAEYTVWVAPVDEKGVVVAENAEFATYFNIKVDHEVSEVTHNDAVLSMSLKGADKYFVGVVKDPMASYSITLEAYMAESVPWSYMVNGYADYIELFVEDGDYSGETALKMSDLNEGKLDFNTTYYYWVVPYQAGTVYNDYASQFEPYVGSFTTAPIQAGGTCAASFSDEEVKYTSVSVTVTPSEGTEAVYYAFYDAETWAELESEQDSVIVNDIITNCWSPLFAEDVVSESSLSAGSTVVLATVSLGTDGLYGEVVTSSFRTMSYPSEVNEAHTAVFTDPVVDFTSINVNVTPAAGTVAYWAYMTDLAVSDYETDADLIAYLLKQKTITSATDLTVKNLAAGNARTLVVLVVGDDNKYMLYKKAYSTQALPYAENITVAVESCDVLDAEAGTYKAVINVTGATHVIARAYYTGSTAANIIDLSAVQYGADKSSTTYLYADVVDGKATLEFKPQYYCYTLYVTAYNVDENKVSAIAKTSVAYTFAE